MKIITPTIRWLVFTVMMICTVTVAQPRLQNDSLLTLERIDEAIAFLQDSQQVAATVEHLKLVAAARRSLLNSKAGNTSPKTEAAPFNIFVTGQKFASGSVRMYHDLIDEIQNFSIQVTTASGALATGDVRGRVFTLLMVAVVALVVGLLIGFGLLRVGRRLLSSGVRGAGSITGLVITRGSFGTGGVATLFLMSMATAGSNVHGFFKNAAFAYLAYQVVITIMAVLFSPQRSVLRTIPCSDEAAIQITRRCRNLFRTMLALYLLYSAASILNLPNSRKLIATLFQILMTVMIPRTAFRLRQWYLDPFQRIAAVHTRHRRLFSVAGMVLGRLPLLILMYLIVLGGISMFGPESTYRFFIHGTIQTTAALAMGALLSGLWMLVMRYIGGTQKRLFAQYPDLQERIGGNLKIVRSVGYIGIGVVLTVFLIRIWGIKFSMLFSSRVPVFQVTLRVVVIIAGAWLLVQAAYFILSRFSKAAQARMLRADGANPIEIEKRISTLSGIFQKIVTVAVVVIGSIMVMDELGFDIKAMVAGVGIVGLAVGFGAQNLVRDVISGLFVIFENKIRVGDVAIINGTGGLVEQVNLRTSVLRSLDGTIHVFPNGAITTLSNMTHEFSYYVFDLGVAYKENTDRVSEVVKQIAEELRAEPEYRDAILEPLEILGVDAFADSAVIIKARIKTVPIKQWFVGREMNRRIKLRFDELGIEIPFPHQTLYFGEASKPFEIRTVNGEKQKDEV